MTFGATILGGLGVFLLGMKLLSDNLRSAAGDALRLLLAKFTGGRLSSVATGTVFTALVQSSSATTLATIGFVSAGLLSFGQAVGVIFGANLGTTATSWLVALLGLRVSISAFAYPMVGIGALVTLLTRGRKSHFGAALAGFGLIFVGIDILQVGMADLAEQIDLGAIDAEGLGGQLILVGIGFVMTVLMQSSSAAIATTLTALFAGAVELPQAAALVIGQSVGTTATAALAAIGASLAARRTAAAHIVFNLLTAMLALLTLPLFLMAHGSWIGAGNQLADATAIAIFHTLFKMLGVAVLLPVVEPFSRFVYQLIPGTEAQYAWGLDKNAAAIPAVAVEAARTAQQQMYGGLAGYTREGLANPAAVTARGEQLDAIELGLIRSREFLDHIQTDPDSDNEYQRHLAVLHTQDHLERLHRRLQVSAKPFRLIDEHAALGDARSIMNEAITRASTIDLESEGAAELQALSEELKQLRQRRRHHLLKSAASGQPAPSELDDLLRALQWSDRVVFHLWRATYYLEGGVFHSGDELRSLDTEIDGAE